MPISKGDAAEGIDRRGKEQVEDFAAARGDVEKKEGGKETGITRGQREI